MEQAAFDPAALVQAAEGVPALAFRR
ncbi:hypothetical protein AB0B89_24320 [Sphaerisporangium sp. NPDC049002]